MDWVVNLPCVLAIMFGTVLEMQEKRYKMCTKKCDAEKCGTKMCGFLELKKDTESICFVAFIRPSYFSELDLKFGIKPLVVFWPIRGQFEA